MAKDRINVVCVLRTGGDYTTEYVRRLYEGVQRSLALSQTPFTFYCFTDDPTGLSGPEFAGIFPVVRALPAGWWAKPCVFEMMGPTIYLDLDSIVVGSLSRLVERVCTLHRDGERAIWMMESIRWRRGATRLQNERWASGVMAWTQNWQSITAEYITTEAQKHFKNDQQYIAEQVMRRWAVPRVIQAHVSIASYKWDCMGGVPAGTDIVAFHGHPRPHEVGWQLPGILQREVSNVGA